MTNAAGWAAAYAAVVFAVGCGGGMPAEPADTAAEMETAAAPAAGGDGAGSILRVDPRLDALVPADAVIEKVADGFVFTEGPVWDRASARLLSSPTCGATPSTSGRRRRAPARSSSRCSTATARGSR